MQVAGDKAAVILGVSDGVGSARAKAEIIGVVKVSVVRVSIREGMEVDAEVGIEVGAKVGIATIGKIRRTRTGSIVGVFEGFETGVRSSGKS
jgi:hypothetical protein